MDPTLRLILAAVALVLAAVDVIRSNGRGLTSWAAVALAVIVLVDNWDAGTA